LSGWIGGPAGGQLVVAVHGWTEDGRVWAPVARRLVDAGHRVAVYDQRGHGASTVGSAGCTIEGIAADVRAVLDHLDARDAVLVGHSMGGMAAQAFAIRHKEALADRVAALVLVGTAARPAELPRHVEAVSAGVLSSPLLGAAMRSARLGPFLVRRTVGRPVWEHLRVTSALFAATPPATRREFFLAMSALDHIPDLPAVAVPTVVVSGTKDRLLPHPLSHRLANAIPGARLVALDGAGHQLMFEEPGRVAEIILDVAQQRAA
jgi:pimeloyl-ACP methyl ester carboxylesterase